MKAFRNIFSSTLVALIIAAATTFSMGSSASAQALFHYTGNGNSEVTQGTPIFNNFDNTPENTGPETNFVGIGDASAVEAQASEFNHASYQKNVTSCSDGSEFYVRTYVHNNASELYNSVDPSGNPVGVSGPVQGQYGLNGPAVAHNTAITATVTGSGNSFTFNSTISASNAASVSDSATINCGSGNYRVTLVPGSAKEISINNDTSTYYNYASTSWSNFNLGSATAIGSDSPSSGTVCGCWDCRVITVYEVMLTAIAHPTPTYTATCNLFDIDATNNKTITVNNFTYTATNISIDHVVVNWGDGQTDTIANPTQVEGASHTYTGTGSYTAYATVYFTNPTPGGAMITSGGPGTSCAKPVVLTSVPVTPQTTTTPSATTTSLVNTGPGSVVAIFVGISAVGALGYNFFSKKLLRK